MDVPSYSLGSLVPPGPEMTEGQRYLSSMDTISVWPVQRDDGCWYVTFIVDGGYTSDDDTAVMVEAHARWLGELLDEVFAGCPDRAPRVQFRKRTHGDR